MFVLFVCLFVCLFVYLFSVGGPGQCGHCVLLSKHGVQRPPDEVLGHRVGQHEGDKPAGQAVRLDPLREAIKMEKIKN